MKFLDALYPSHYKCLVCSKEIVSDGVDICDECLEICNTILEEETEVLEDDDLYTIKVYGDLHYHNLIETRNNLTESQMKNSVYNMNEYMNQASTITYTFKPENGKYYFYSSNITN